MIPRRVEQPPARRLGVGPPVIVEHDPGEVAQLAVPLALRQQEPVERLAQAACQGLREERLRVADEADLSPAQAGLLPDQPHQAVGVGAGGGLALPVGDEDESGVPRATPRSSSARRIWPAKQSTSSGCVGSTVS